MKTLKLKTYNENETLFTVQGNTEDLVKAIHSSNLPLSQKQELINGITEKIDWIEDAVQNDDEFFLMKNFGIANGEYLVYVLPENHKETVIK